MVSRLVLGCGTAGRTVLEALETWPGDLHVVVAEKGRADALRDDTVDARHGDVADPSNYPATAEVVYVAGDDPATNLAAARAARERFPEALVVARTGDRADEATVTALEAVADRVVDPDRVVAEAVLEVATGAIAQRIARLLRVLRRIDSPLAVVMHDNPDPDAIASALALARIAEFVGLDAEACYFGEISHQENRALVNLLDLPLRALESADEIDDYGSIALVDHSRPGVNDGLDPDTEVAIVIDHHPPRAPVSASFVDLWSEVGATSTLLTRYLRRLDIEPEPDLATALLYGIRVDTKDFTREVSDTDYEAAAFLLAYADADTLRRVESPSKSAEVLETLGKAIRNRMVRGEVLVTGVGEINDRDALGQAADRLLDMEGVRITLVYGIMDGTVHVSGRARGTDVDLGETLRDALGQIGSAGGHADMAAAQVPLGLHWDVSTDSKERVSELVDEMVRGRFFETLEAGPRTVGGEPIGDYASDLEFDAPSDGESSRKSDAARASTPGAGPGSVPETRPGGNGAMAPDPASRTAGDDESDAGDDESDAGDGETGERPPGEEPERGAEEGDRGKGGSGRDPESEPETASEP
jgi:nanoRNase/pAp phosphatase (c-di-AMP/oligoRNAs hydrolase)